MKIKYPIYFEGNTCVHCGCNGSLVFVDRMGNQTTRPIYPICKRLCANCNTEFFVKWITSEDNRMIPICVSHDEIKEFENNIVKFAMENKRKPL